MRDIQSVRGVCVDGQSRRDRRPDRRLRPVRRPDDPAARADRPHVRRGGPRRRDPGPPQGLTGSAIYVILDGEASVIIDGQQRATLSRGDFFGEVSILLGEAPGADIVAPRPLGPLVLGGPRVRRVLLDTPPLMYRMPQAQAPRLRNANRWRS